MIGCSLLVYLNFIQECTNNHDKLTEVSSRFKKRSFDIVFSTTYLIPVYYIEGKPKKRFTSFLICVIQAIVSIL